MSDPIIINKELPINIMDFLIMQEVSEMKLNRALIKNTVDGNITVKFYTDYLASGKSFKNNDGTDNVNLIDEFKTSLGSQTNLNKTINFDKDNQIKYDGGAGKYTKISSSQVDDFITNYKILDYYGDDTSGFSATVFENLTTHEKTISFRSTEFNEDYFKDTAADNEISDNGTAWGQSLSMVKYIEKLKTTGVITSTDTLNVTGYSLGGALGSTFYKMYSNDFNIKNLYVFNGPGTGNLTSPNTQIDPYISLKNDLNAYNALQTSLIQFYFQKSQAHLPNEIIASNYKTYLINTTPTLWTEAQKNSLIAYADYLSHDVNYENSTQFTNFVFSSINPVSSVGLTQEYEQNKDLMVAMNSAIGTNGLATTLYGNNFYQTYKNYLINRYNAKKAGDNKAESLSDALDGKKTGQLVDPSFYDNKAIWISGTSSFNYFNIAPNDYNFVSNSNKYTNPLDIIIEDRLELEKNGIPLPINSVIEYLTKSLTGDLGNTHSITLLNKSLSLMSFLATIEGKSTIDVQDYTGLISSASPEKAANWIMQGDINHTSALKDLNIGDGNSVAMVINNLYKMIVPGQQKSNDIIFNNTIEGWADIGKIDQLEQRKTAISNQLISTGTIVTLHSFYQAKNEDFNYLLKNTNNITYDSKDFIFEKIKQNDSEGMAYRYALENLNNFVVLGLDYSNMVFKSKEVSSQSDQWYLTRIDVLLEMVKQDVGNYGDFVSQKTSAIIDDKDQYIRFHTQSELNKMSLSNSTSLIQVENEANTPVGIGRRINDNYQTFYKQWTSKSHVDGIYNNIIQSYNDELKQYQFTVANGNQVNQKTNDFSFTDNIYYLNPLSSSFFSRSEKADEKIFIAPDKLSIFNHLDGTNPFATITHGSYSNFNDFDIVVNVDLKGGDDYVEVKSDYASTIAKSGSKTYYIEAKETKIMDYSKTGTITLDGILLKGGVKTAVNKYVQTEIINGVTNTISYQLDYISNALVITHENNGNKVYIESMANMGNGVAFGFNLSERNNFIYSPSLTKEDFNVQEELPQEQIISLQSSYLSFQQFLNSVSVNVNITSANAISSKEGTTLMIYDKISPTHQIAIRNFYDTDGTVKVYNSTVEKVNSNNEIYYEPVSSTIILPTGLGADPSLGIYDISRLLIEDNGRVIDHRGSDEYLIPNTIKGINLQKDGNNLIFTYNGSVDSPDYKVTIKNYFAFDHSVYTDIFSYQNGVKTEIPYNDLNKYITIKLSDVGVFYQMDNNVPSNTVTGGIGDDTVVGTTRNEVFQSLGGYDRSLATNQYTYNAFVADGNDIFTGGGGEDIFIFSGNFGSDVITDFRSDDKIYLGYNQTLHSMKRDGDDLILYSNNNVNNQENYGIDYGMVNELRVKDYFLYIDYQNDSRISYIETTGSAGQINYEVIDESTMNIATYTLSPQEVKDGETKEMNTKDFNQGETVIDNSNPNHPVALSHNYKNIIGNEDDNIITITKNNTVVKGNNDNGAVYDGDDTYIINITETVPTLKNTYRTEIDFGLNGGNDIIKNGDYKENNQYGDIVKIKGVTLNQLVFNKEEDNGILKSIKIILEDGSSIKLEVNNSITNNSELLKLDNQVLTLTQINALINTHVVTGDSNDNTFDYSSSYKNQEIHGMSGNDTITGGFGDDVLEGGKGYDDFYFSGGKDTYIFNKGDNVDVFHFKDVREKLNSTFLISNDFNTADIKYSFDDTNHKIYLSFSQYEGVVFPNSDWLDFVFLQDGITIKKVNGEIVTPPDQVNMVTGLPFITPANLITGTSSTDNITTDNSVSNVVYAKEGNDTIVSQGSQNSYSLIFGGEGDDNITANRRDIVAVKNGDGTDTISSNTKDYMIDILRNTTRVVNGQETLFDIAVNGNDLSLKYGDTASNDKVIIKDYFLNNQTGDISLGIYEESLDQTKVYYLNNILQDLGITKASLQAQGETTINKSDVILRGSAQYGKVLGGEIAYEYLHGNYQTSDQVAITLNKMNTTLNTVVDKHNV